MLKVSSPAGAHTPLTGAPRHGPPAGSRAGLGTDSDTEGAEEGGGAPAGKLDQVISARPAPGSHPRQWMAPRQQIRWGLPADRRPIAQSAGPIPAEEGSNRCAVITRVSAPVGRGLAAGDLGSRWLRLRPELPTMV